MSTFFNSLTFKYFLVPLFTIFLNIFVKTASKNDVYSKFSKEDLAVGLQISATALVALILYSASLAQQIIFQSPTQQNIIMLREKLIATPWLIFSLVIGLWGVSTLVRKLGWKSAEELNWGCGLVIPFLCGLFTLFFAVNWIGG